MCDMALVVPAVRAFLCSPVCIVGELWNVHRQCHVEVKTLDPEPLLLGMVVIVVVSHFELNLQNGSFRKSVTLIEYPK